MPVGKRPFLHTLLLFWILNALSINDLQSQADIAGMEVKSEEDYDSLLNAYLTYDSLLLAELENDSVSIFSLIDSLFAADLSISSLSFRFGYNSSILNAGRDYGFQQYGFSSGLSYYHKTGIFTDLLSYWNSEIDPNYYLNTISIGYFGTFSSKWSFLASYDHFFYNQNNELATNFPLTNALNFSTYLDLNFISAGLDYSYLFGDQSAHRLRPNISAVIRASNVGFIDRITIMPNASMLLGNSSVFTQSTNRQLLRQIIQKIGWRRFLRLYTYRREDVEELIFQVSEDNVFGVMNYSLSLPIYVYINNLSVLANYTINFPVALPGEAIDLDSNSFFGISLIYNFYFK